MFSWTKKSLKFSKDTLVSALESCIKWKTPKNSSKLWIFNRQNWLCIAFWGERNSFLNTCISQFLIRGISSQPHPPPLHMKYHVRPWSHSQDTPRIDTCCRYYGLFTSDMVSLSLVGRSAFLSVFSHEFNITNVSSKPEFGCWGPFYFKSMYPMNFQQGLVQPPVD